MEKWRDICEKHSVALNMDMILTVASNETEIKADPEIDDDDDDNDDDDDRVCLVCSQAVLELALYTRIALRFRIDPYASTLEVPAVNHVPLCLADRRPQGRAKGHTLPAKAYAAYFYFWLCS